MMPGEKTFPTFEEHYESITGRLFREGPELQTIGKRITPSDTEEIKEAIKVLGEGLNRIEERIKQAFGAEKGYIIYNGIWR